MEVLMPQLGETVTEGKITVWFKAVGDSIAPGDNLFEIETDKVSMEVPATSGGILREIRVKQGEVAPVSAIVAVIGDGEAKAPPASLDPYHEVRTPARNFGPATVANGAKASPLARRVAFEAGIDLTTVKGSGPHGRIHAADLKTPIAVPAKPVTDAPYERVPLDAMRKTIARRLVEAKQTVPHFYLTSDVDISRLLALREEANSAVKLSINDFIIKGLALALQRVPAANAIWGEEAILRFKHSEVGVAVAIE